MIHILVINLHITVTQLLDDVAILCDEGVREVVPHNMPPARAAVLQESPHGIVARRIGDAKDHLHQRRHHVIVGRAVVANPALHLRIAEHQRHLRLETRIVARMPPVVFVVLVEFLSMVASDEDNGVIHQPPALQPLEHPAHQRVYLVEAIAVEIEERLRIGIIVQAGVIGIAPCWLEAVVPFLGKGNGVSHVVEEEREERPLSAGGVRKVAKKKIGQLAVAVVSAGAFGSSVDVDALEEHAVEGWRAEIGRRVDLDIITIFLQLLNEDRLQRRILKTLPIVRRETRE